MAQVLTTELTASLRYVALWTDSTTVLTWLQSDTRRFKVFVRTRVAEIQELTDWAAWRYVDSANNLADDITRGRHLSHLGEWSHWCRGPPFPHEPPDQWTETPHLLPLNDEEPRKPFTCLHVITPCSPPLPEADQFQTFKDLLKATAQVLREPADAPLTA